MAKNNSKSSFLGGAAILAGAVFIVKIIGAVYKIPLGNIIGDEGKAHFTVAYNIYNLLLTISTAGLPLAISKLPREAHAQGRENEKRKIFRTAIWLFLVLGIAFFLFMFFNARGLAIAMEDELAYWSIKALSPAVFCVCLLACMRGYTQGQGNMRPTAISQILEAFCKLIIGLSLAWYFLRSGLGVEFGAAGAILGVTVGTILSMFFMIFYLVRHRDRESACDVPPSSGALMKNILAIGIPITLSNSAMSIITLVDSKIVLGQLGKISAQLTETPTALYGQYTFGMDLINLPPSFVFPVTMSLIPFAAAAMAKSDAAGANRIISSAFRIISLLAIPAGVGLSVLAKPILVTLYPAQPEAALAAASHLRMLGIACIFICLMNLTNAILQSYGHERIPICTMLAGGATKIIMNYVLVGNPAINIHGAPISTLCCYLVIVGLNLFFVWKHSPEKPRYFNLFAKPVLASAIMGAAAWAVQGLVFRFFSASHSTYGATAISLIAGICGGVAVYAVLVLALRMLTREDVQSLPKGDKIARILRLK